LTETSKPLVPLCLLSSTITWPPLRSPTSMPLATLLSSANSQEVKATVNAFVLGELSRRNGNQPNSPRLRTVVYFRCVG
jgi:hypothetical protein